MPSFFSLLLFSENASPRGPVMIAHRASADANLRHKTCYHNRASWTTYLVMKKIIRKSLEKIKIVLFLLFESYEILLHMYSM